jgi:hypothetical protein
MQTAKLPHSSPPDAMPPDVEFGDHLAQRAEAANALATSLEEQARQQRAIEAAARAALNELSERAKMAQSPQDTRM